MSCFRVQGPCFQLEREPRINAPWQALRAPGSGNETELDLRKSQHHVPARHAIVGRKSELEPSSQGRPVESHDHQLGAGFHASADLRQMRGQLDETTGSRVSPRECHSIGCHDRAARPGDREYTHARPKPGSRACWPRDRTPTATIWQSARLPSTLAFCANKRRLMSACSMSLTGGEPPALLSGSRPCVRCRAYSSECTYAARANIRSRCFVAKPRFISVLFGPGF